VNRYRVIFKGRKIGAIGVSQVVSLDLEADSSEHAYFRCYETHEHIQAPRVFLIGPVVKGNS
jgi:hypothetical protein